MLLKWRGSVYKLFWKWVSSKLCNSHAVFREFIIWTVLYTVISLTYRFVLCPQEDLLGWKILFDQVCIQGHWERQFWLNQQIFMWKGAIKLVFRQGPTRVERQPLSGSPLWSCRTLETVNKFTDMIPMSFVLGFYVSIIVSRWWQQVVGIVS